jgi:predicted phage-related endonuclease
MSYSNELLKERQVIQDQIKVLDRKKREVENKLVDACCPFEVGQIVWYAGKQCSVISREFCADYPNYIVVVLSSKRVKRRVYQAHRKLSSVREGDL